MESNANVIWKEEELTGPREPKADHTDMKKFINICNYVSRELVS